MKTYLVSNGIDGNKIVTQGMSERQPIASNTTEDGRAKNRRV
jgi:OOP family OmpA-OmpF porin